MTVRLCTGVAALLMAVLFGAAPAAYADDIFEIDDRLVDAGVDEAFTEAYAAAEGDGVRVVVDFDSDSVDQDEYEQQAGRIAEVIWNHLDGRVLVVDVSTTYAVDWEESLPPTVSFTATQLRAEFGPRPDELDVAGVETVEDFETAGSFFLAGAVGVWLLSIVATAGITVLIMRGNRDRVAGWAPAGPWGQPGPWGQGGPWGSPGPWGEPGPWGQPGPCGQGGQWGQGAQAAQWGQQAAPHAWPVAAPPSAQPQPGEVPPDLWTSPRG